MVQDTAVVWWNHVAALHGIALLLSQVVDLVVDLVVELGSRADLVVELSPRDNSRRMQDKKKYMVLSFLCIAHAAMQLFLLICDNKRLSHYLLTSYFL